MKSILNEIFTELVSKYKKFFSTEQEHDATKETATNRLRFVLMHDRTQLAPDTMEKMRDELLEVITKYVVVDEEALDLNLAAEGDAIALLASIPILRAKTKEEQEEAIKALEAKKAEESLASESDEETDEESEEETSEESTEEAEDQESKEEQEDVAEESDASDEEAEIEEAVAEDLETTEEQEEKQKKKSSK